MCNIGSGWAVVESVTGVWQYFWGIVTIIIKRRFRAVAVAVAVAVWFTLGVWVVEKCCVYLDNKLIILTLSLLCLFRC